MILNVLDHVGNSQRRAWKVDTEKPSTSYPCMQPLELQLYWDTGRTGESDRRCWGETEDGKKYVSHSCFSLRLTLARGYQCNCAWEWHVLIYKVKWDWGIFAQEAHLHDAWMCCTLHRLLLCDVCDLSGKDWASKGYRRVPFCISQHHHIVRKSL